MRVLPYLLNGAYLAALTALAPILACKAVATGKYRVGLLRKLRGVSKTDFTDDGRPVVWLHAVSVGEILLLRPLVALLAQRRPDLRLVLSTTTNTGYAVAVERFPNLTVVYAPFDFTWSVRGTFNRLRPILLVLAELELWPNLLLEARRRNVPVAVANARLGEKSHRGYRRLGRLLSGPLSAVRWWGAQSTTYADRIRSLPGTMDAVVEVTGSMKYDGAVGDRLNAATQSLRDLFGITDDDRVFVAGSTSDPEEGYVLDAYLTLAATRPNLRLVLAPRQADRFDAVAALLSQRNVTFVRRSRLGQGTVEPAAVVLLDTIGELGAAWGLADVAFVGGTLDGKRGGQSMIEPAAYGAPTCFGPHTWNFSDAVARLTEADAVVVLAGPQDLAPTLARWLDDPPAAAALGARAKAFVAEQQGSTEKTYADLLLFLPPREG
ncbi:MAG: 3-deoxy-D-manno-octulosonic acid transferase [Planctomycetia bacterium]